MVTSLIVWIIVGAIAGWLAGYAMHRNTDFDVADIVLGMVGALVGGFLANALLEVPSGGLNIWSVVVAFVGALIVAWLYEAVTGEVAQ